MEYLNERITEALSTALPPHKINDLEIDLLVRTFESQVYGILSEGCKPAPTKAPVHQRRKTYPSRLLQKLHRSKRDARREVRRLESRGSDSSDARRNMYKVVRAHNKISRITQKNLSNQQSTYERKRFLHDPHKYAKALFNPPQSGKPNFSKDVAESYFRE